MERDNEKETCKLSHRILLSTYPAFQTSGTIMWFFLAFHWKLGSNTDR